jgi:hypothetical protein
MMESTRPVHELTPLAPLLELEEELVRPSLIPIYMSSYGSTLLFIQRKMEESTHPVRQLSVIHLQ